MEEKILMKSEQYKVKKLFKIFAIIGILISAILFAYFFEERYSSYNWHYGTDHEHSKYCYKSRYMDEFYEDEGESEGLIEWKMDCPQVVYGSAFSYAIHIFSEAPIGLLIVVSPMVVLILLGSLLYFWLHSYELTVTDKRIFGKVAWGKRVDLPVDSVSATAKVNLLKGISVSTSSGRIKFLLIKNVDAIYKVMSDLLIERQQEKGKNIIVESSNKNDTADELKKFKELLDSGVITQEEFDAKKKQLLGL